MVARGDQLIQVWDLWTHELLGEYAPAEIENFGVSDIPGHGNFTFKFIITDRNSTDIEVEVEVEQQ